MKQAKWIKLLGPFSDHKEIKAVTRVIKSGWWGLGIETEKFELEFANFVGAKYAIAVNSCTAALHLALKVAVPNNKVKDGNIIVPAFTFVSSAVVGLYEGLKVIFADIDETNLCLDPKEVRAKINKKTVAIISVHYSGNLANLDYGQDRVPIIEDCAHLGGYRKQDGHKNTCVWSFHPVKNIATGDGGMITTNDYELAKKIRKLRWFGIDLSTYDREKKGYNWEYLIDELGYKYHANDINSAIGRVQLKKVIKNNKRRSEIALRYNHELKGLPIILPKQSKTWHLYVIRVNSKQRSKLVDFLRERRISPGVHYKPLYKYPIFNWNIKSKGMDLPNTEKIWQEVLSIPIYAGLSNKEQTFVIKALHDFFS